MPFLRISFICLFLLGTSLSWSQSRRVAGMSPEKRWTLSDWLSQRDRNRMMDLWLAFNSPSPYELMLGGSYASYLAKPEAPGIEASYSSMAGEFSAHAQIFGVTTEYENNTKENFNDLAGIFNLRVFGNSIQSSYLALNYGLRTRIFGVGNLNTTGHEILLRQQFAQASLQMYLHKYFGIDGYYRYFMPSENSDLGKIKETHLEGGAFIDFGSLRVFGRWYEERQTTTAPGISTDSSFIRTGVKTGVKFYF